MDFFARSKARLTFDVPAALYDPNIVPMSGEPDPPIVAPLVQVGEDHFVARHRVGGLY